VAKNWTANDIPDLSGKTYVITGTTSGLGTASAIEFAKHGGSVILTGRNRTKLSETLSTVELAATGAAPKAVELDLADLKSVHKAADEIRQLTSTIDVLLNNAGVMATPKGTTEDGFERQIGTNHLGHFALTGLLLPNIPAHDRARIVTVASLAHKAGKVVPEDLSFENRRYDPWSAYGQSKLANLLFTLELAQKAKAAGWNLIAAAAHPGFSATNLINSGPSITQNRIGRAGATGFSKLVSQSAEDGALPSLFAATAPEVLSGDYYGPGGFLEVRGAPKKVGRTSAAKDGEVAAALWERSEQLTGVSFDFKR
jgi:NAD(P)-dependent dehydrogenase (short-subunit alcohol dehydrogenase family)